MNARAIIPLVVGLGIGIFAVKIFIGVLQKAKGASAADVVQVVRAKGPIEATAKIEETMLEQVSASKSFMPEGIFVDPKKVIGRVTAQYIPKGMPILSELLAPVGTPPGMVARIDKGARAVAVKIDEYAGVAGWLKSGCRVDVVVVLSGKTGGTISKVILQNVEVLAVGQEFQSPGTKASLTRSVTLLVSPKDVPKLHLAATRGKIRLALRGKDDKGEPPSELTTDNDLFNTGIVQEDDNQQDGDTLLGRLFSKQPKIDPNTADEGVGELDLVKPNPLQLASATASQVWPIEVISGENVYKVLFENKSGDARRVIVGRKANLGSANLKNIARGN
ncbi:MAG: Flp pilus assembly protein CpaB [Planctomycetota bacterium]|jgi:pilus assembly protein CpaB